ncbi:MAG TPA: hypothetical protein VFX65_11985 [Candidatus Limnocylindrales bacterium]|nr:hypothetical protein [Candidatus Limnocylindrales bacterium]
MTPLRRNLKNRVLRRAREDRMRHRAKASGIAIGLAFVALLGVPSLAYACSATAWPVSEITTRAELVVEADVTSLISTGGYALDVRRVFKGDLESAHIQIGTVQVDGGGECSGRLSLDVGDRLLLALAHPDTALAIESAVWWIEADGSVERSTGLVANSGPTTYGEVLRALGLPLPDTATAREELDRSVDHSVMLFALAVVSGLIVLGLPASRTRTRRRY